MGGVLVSVVSGVAGSVRPAVAGVVDKANSLIMQQYLA